MYILKKMFEDFWKANVAKLHLEKICDKSKFNL